MGRSRSNSFLGKKMHDASFGRSEVLNNAPNTGAGNTLNNNGVIAESTEVSPDGTTVDSGDSAKLKLAVTSVPGDANLGNEHADDGKDLDDDEQELEEGSGDAPRRAKRRDTGINISVDETGAPSQSFAAYMNTHTLRDKVAHKFNELLMNDETVQHLFEDNSLGRPNNNDIAMYLQLIDIIDKESPGSDFCSSLADIFTYEEIDFIEKISVLLYTYYQLIEDTNAFHLSNASSESSISSSTYSSTTTASIKSTSSMSKRKLNSQDFKLKCIVDDILSKDGLYDDYRLIKFTTLRDDYKILQPIGNDRYDQLCLFNAEFVPHKIAVAVRIVPLIDMSLGEVSLIANEIKNSNDFDYYGLRRPLTSFMVGSELWIVYKIMNAGSLSRILHYINRSLTSRTKNLLDEKSICYIMFKVLQTLQHIHGKGCAYGGLQAEHILLDQSGHVKLSSMKFVVELHHSVGSVYLNTASRVPWLPPEYLSQSGVGYNEKIDIYSFGITLLEIVHTYSPYLLLPTSKSMLLKLYGLVSLTDHNPIDCAPPTDQPENMKNTNSRIRENSIAYMSKHLKQVIDACLQSNPNLRPSAAKLLTFPFFKKAKAFPESLISLLRNLPSLDKYLPRRYIVNEQEIIIRKPSYVDETESFSIEFKKEIKEQRILFIADQFPKKRACIKSPPWEMI